MRERMGMAKTCTNLCPPMVRFVTDRLGMGGFVGLDVGTDVGSFRPI